MNKLSKKTWRLGVLARDYSTQSRGDAKNNLKGLRYE